MSLLFMKFRIPLVLALTLILVTTGLVNLKDRASWKAPWDGITWATSPAGPRAVQIEPSSPGHSAAIKPGDILVSINGTAVADLKAYTSLLYKLGAGSEVTYVVRRDSAGRNLPARLTIESKSSLSVTDAYRVIVGLGYLIVGLYILLHSEAAGSLHFYLLCLVSFVLYSFRYTTKLELRDFFVYWGSSAALCLLPALFLHFCLCFPHRKEFLRRNQHWKYAIYLPSVILLIVHIRWFAGKLSFIGFPRNPDVRLLIDRVSIAYYSIYFAFGALVLGHTRWTAKDRILKQQMKWISYGTLAAILPFVVFYAIPYFFIGTRSNAYIEAAILPLVLIPLCFGYAIIKFRLMDIDIIFKNRTAYFLSSSVILCFYFLLVVLGGKLGELVAPEAGFVSIGLSALLTAFLFTPVRNKTQKWIDRIFYKEEYDYRQSLLEFGKTLSSEISLTKLSRLILERICKTFNVEGSVLLLKDELDHKSYKIIDSTGIDLPRLTIDFSDVDKTGFDHFQALRVRGREIGLLGLGKKRNGNFFTTEDLELLEALSGYAAIALENAKLHRSVEAKAYEYAQLKDYSENIIESINVGVIVLDLEGRVSSCNAAFEQLYGVTRQEIAGKSMGSVFTEDFVQSVLDATGNESWVLNDTRNIYKLYLDTKKNGPRAIVNLSMAPLVNRADSITGTLLIFDEVTERVQLENQLLQAEKLSSIGLLAAGIAHEVNTPLAGISSYTQMLLKQVMENDPKREILSRIERQTFRASEIINSLLNFSRMNGTEFKTVNINNLIHESLSLLEHQFKSNKISVQEELTDQLPLIMGNTGKLQQVLINLFLNAKDAMPCGGVLRISTTKNERMILIDITDTGLGIPEENLSKIYDPFFTTKGGKGTGLGLAVSYGIIQEHSGRILVESSLGKGTHFRIKLPIHNDQLQ